MEKYRNAINKYLLNKATITELCIEYDIERDILRNYIMNLNHFFTIDELKHMQVSYLTDSYISVEIGDGVKVEKITIEVHK